MKRVPLHPMSMDSPRATQSEVLPSSTAGPRWTRRALLTSALVGAHPEIQSLRGPHGLTLLHHARAGGDAAQPVVDYLEEVGGADPPLPIEPLSPEEVGLYVGKYRFDPGEGDLLEVSESDGALRIARSPAAPEA